MLKKTTLLSLATAAAVVVTSAGTFAAYDTVTATATAENVTFRAPVTIAAAEFTMSGEEDALNTAPSATGVVTFTVEDAESLAQNLQLEITVQDGSVSQQLTEEDFTFSVTDSSDGSNSGLSGSETTWNDTDLTQENKYTVTATLKDSAAEKLADEGHNGQISILVTGTLN